MNSSIARTFLEGIMKVVSANKSERHSIYQDYLCVCYVSVCTKMIAADLIIFIKKNIELISDYSVGEALLMNNKG